jgi:hypothetical protein
MIQATSQVIHPESSDCLSLLERELGEPLRRYPNGWSRWACPLHGGVKPSLAACTSHWKCHVCGQGGDSLSFIMALHGLDFAGALRYLGQPGASRPKFQAPKQETPISISLDPQALEDIARRAEAKLWAGDNRGRDYLFGRGLSEDSIRQARLGYIPPDKPHYVVHGLKVFPGILIPSTYQGQVEFLQFRNIWAVGKEDRYRSLGPARGTLFLGDTLRPFEAIYLFEGAFDALIAQQLGANAAALSSAANTLAPRWYVKIATAPVVHLCGDADPAGRAFMDKHRALGPHFQAWAPPEQDLNALYLQFPEQARQALGLSEQATRMENLRQIFHAPREALPAYRCLMQKFDCQTLEIEEYIGISQSRPLDWQDDHQLSPGRYWHLRLFDGLSIRPLDKNR